MSSTKLANLKADCHSECSQAETQLSPTKEGETRPGHESAENELTDASYLGAESRLRGRHFADLAEISALTSLGSVF